MAGYSQNSFVKALVGAQNWVCRMRFIRNYARDHGTPSIRLKNNNNKLRECTKKIINYFSKKHVVGTQKNRLNETVLLSTQNIHYNLWIRNKIQFLFVCFVALRPKSTAMVMAGRSVHLTTLIPGQA